MENDGKQAATATSIAGMRGKGIWFIYPLIGLAFAPLLPVERVIRAGHGILRRIRR